MNKQAASYDIQLNNLSFRYGKREIISDFSQTISQWKKILISWPSWSGKTTFLKLLGGIIAPSSGTIKIGTIPLTDLEKKRFSIFGYAFVDADFFEQMNVWENIRIFSEILGAPIDTDWYSELLEYFELTEYELAPVCELSAGQRERVNLIRAFVHQPQILLLDEPGSHLDEALQSKLIRFITKYHEEHNATLIISSHGEFEDSFFDTFIDFHADYHLSVR